MAKISLKSEKREVFGRKVKTLRSKGLIPGNVFGKNIKSEAVVVDAKEFEKAFEEAGETQIIDLSGRPVLVSNVSYDPVTENYLHVDFRQVDLKEKIKANVPVETEGESPAEKQSIGTVVQQIDELEVEALPAHLPEKIVVDISALAEVDQAIYVKDLKVSAEVEVLTDKESIVVKVEPPQKEEEPQPVAEVPAEGEVPTEGGEVPAEGEEVKPEESKEPQG